MNSIFGLAPSKNIQSPAKIIENVPKYLYNTYFTKIFKTLQDNFFFNEFRVISFDELNST